MNRIDTPCAVMNLRKSARVITQYYDQELKPTGLKSTQFALLRVLSVRSTTVGDFAVAIDMDRSTLLRNVRLLEGMGYVALKPGNDRRTRVLELTANGRKALRDAQKHWLRAQRTVVETFGSRRWDRLRAELETFTDIGRKRLDETK